MTKNGEIDKLRLAATKALFERRDVIIVSFPRRARTTSADGESFECTYG